MAVLHSSVDGEDSCSNANLKLFTTGGENEVITVKFGESFQLLDLKPEGDIREEFAVKWSNKSYDGSNTLALLVVPEKLKVGNVERFEDKKMCIRFYPAAFSDDQGGVTGFSYLADKTCCGELVEKVENN